MKILWSDTQQKKQEKAQEKKLAEYLNKKMMELEYYDGEYGGWNAIGDDIKAKKNQEIIKDILNFIRKL